MNDVGTTHEDLERFLRAHHLVGAGLKRDKSVLPREGKTAAHWTWEGIYRGLVRSGEIVTVGPDGDSAALGPLPDSVRVERFVPQGVLLPHLDVVAHHGGSGTMLGALAHGLPQLVLPHGADQFMNAQALLDTGAGRRLLPEEINPSAVADAVQALISQLAYRESAKAIAADIAAMPGPVETVPKLERLASR